MSNPSDNPNNDPARLEERDAVVERLLDLSASKRGVAVEASQSSTVATALRNQEKIDAVLRRQFAVPPMPVSLLAKLEAKLAAGVPDVSPEAVSLPASVPAPTRQTLPSWAVAAVLIMGLGAWLFQARQLLFPEESDYEQVGVVAIYQAEVDRGFEPDWFCEDEKRFADTFAERQGQGVWLRPLPEGVRMAGLAYLKGLTAEATSLMAYVDGKPVLVVVEKTDKVPGRLLRADMGSSVQVFTQQFGDLTAIEITPFDEPRVATALYLRDPPAEPTGRVPGT